jgi:malate synthase
LASLIEMWKDEPDGVFPDPQSIGMATPNMIEYQRYNALMMLMAGMKSGKLSHGGPIGGMAAVMIYQPGDPYGRSQYNPLALRAMVIDKIRERLLGLIFVPEKPLRSDQRPTLEEILAGETKGRLYDAYRQSWVASPDPTYVAAGNAPLQAPLAQLQAIIDAPVEETAVKDKPVPTVNSGLTETERRLLESCDLLDAQGKITPWVVTADKFNAPENLFTQELWNNIYKVPEGEITIEHIQHAFYMAANYGFQILDGNFAAAIDDYELSLRFMNDIATYRIDVAWLWTLLHHQAVITKDGYLKRPALTEDGLTPAENAFEVKAGTPFTKDLFLRLWDYHNEWTSAFFAELDRLGNPGLFDRANAPVIMEILKHQLLSPRYIQHSARVLFVLAPAEKRRRGQLLDAIFTLSREQVAERVREGTLDKSILDARDYIYDILPKDEKE